MGKSPHGFTFAVEIASRAPSHQTPLLSKVGNPSRRDSGLTTDTLALGVSRWGNLKEMRILVVEDEKRIADFLSRGLQGAGYAVDTAATGGQALDCVHSADYDLVILDLMLPDMDGMQVLERVRSRQVGPPVLILSARGALDDRVKGLEQGADDYLVKPFAFVELLARVRALLRRGQPAPEKLQVADLTLDCIRRKVARAGESIELAPKEFGILEYMMRNKGRPLSRTMIVEHVWDMDYDGLTNIVDVYIRHLRSKIDDRFTQKLIQTVRGIGYMIESPDKPAERTAEPAAERQV
jgi:heavy metal response regulator